MNCLRARFQHRFNPLHFYCRLKDMGVDDSLAQKVTSLYERLIYRLVIC